MKKTHNISEVWLKASIIGATWAASEIILGSFLHNLRIPFNGNILTTIGFILMIAASYQWQDKGLFWRSGLICALMKTMSPSAVIFGPMIAIFMESVLLEISVRTLGRNVLGFIVGASLAMSWILFQKMANFIIFYGFDIVGIYKQLMGFAGKQLKWNIDMVWSPIIILLLIYLLFGGIAVYFGMKIGKNLNQKNQENTLKTNAFPFDFLPKQNQQFNYSLTWLFFDFVVLVGMLFLINMSPLYLWIPATFVVILAWAFRYKRGLRQLSRPSFWFWFALITMLTAFAVTGMKNEEGKWMEGLIIGLKMNFRAAIVIVGFSVLGTELYNPKIRNYFAKTAFKQLPIALELAFESMQYIISSLPDVKILFKQPILVIKNLIYQAEKRFLELSTLKEVPIFIVTGDLAEGKTTFVKQLLELLRKENIILDGFIAPRLMNETTTIGYDLIHITNNEMVSFLRENFNQNDIGKFKVIEDSKEKAKNWLHPSFLSNVDLIIIDEVGQWELNDLGWKYELEMILNQLKIAQLWVVRRDFVEKVKNKWNVPHAYVFDIKNSNSLNVSKKIIEILKNR